ncbi:MAG: polysaccharide biosynthesis protein [Oscillospiraceae bacterium]|nr:polysaccharide biosynthesis protein [Oscillospiraceae bacterium]
MNDQPIKKQTFLQGTAVLAMATVLVKLMGFLFKVPLNNIIGEDGFGYFNTAYDVYNVLLMISTTGLPVAMSRMISQAQTLGNHAQIKRIYRTSLYVFLTIGMVGSLGMLFFCRQLSVMVTTNENSWAAIAALAPCVLLICLVSAYRGFFQGQSNMTPTSVSQIFEAVTRLVVGLGLAWLVMKLTGEAAVRAQGIVLASGETAQDYGDITLAAGGAILGVTLGSLISVVYLHHKFRQSNQILSLGGGTAKSTRSTMKELLSIAVPITLGSAGLQIINLFDTMIYMRRLTGALQWTEKMADSAKGVYNFCQTVFALPCSFIPTITIAVIPAITASLTRKDLAEAKATSESSVRTMALIAMPCAAGLFVMAEPVIRLLCSTYTEDKIQLAATMLAILGLTVIFNSLVLLLNAIMQAHGDVVTPVVNMLIGGIIKIIVNYILVGQPNLNIVGAPIGTFICYISITALDLIAMKRHISARPAIFKNIIRPGLASAIMGAATFMVYRVLSNAISSWKLACLLSLAFAVVLYAVLVVFLRCLTYEDCMLLPKGEKIAKILRIRKKN